MQKVRLIDHCLAWAMCIVTGLIAVAGPFGIASMAGGI
jgi:hypothetical protein